MFEDLAQYRGVYVTGPQRSGTRICARMVAHDTGFVFHNAEPHNGRTWKQVQQLRSKEEGWVQHGPWLARWTEHLSAPDILIVYMMRDVADILRSQRRIHWHGRREIKRWPGATFETVAQAKYGAWEEQKKSVEHWLEVRYPEDLQAHELWVDQRQGWEYNRWHL